MYIKEYPRVTKDGEEVVEKTNIHAMLGDFLGQMHDRGFVCFTFFTDKEKEMEVIPEDAEFEDLPSALSYTEDFHHEDMMNMVLGYMNTCMDTKSKLAFSSQLQNVVLGEVIDGSDDFGPPMFGDDEEDVY